MMKAVIMVAEWDVTALAVHCHAVATAIARPMGRARYFIYHTPRCSSIGTTTSSLVLSP